jgi:hypothetical protein
MLFDCNLQGRRVRLIRIKDKHTNLKPGDMGTIRYTFDNYDRRVMVVKWDSGSRISLTEGIDDYEIIPKEVSE